MRHFQTSTPRRNKSRQIGKSMCNHHKHWFSIINCSCSKQKSYKGSFHSNHFSQFFTLAHTNTVRKDWGVMEGFSRWLAIYIHKPLFPGTCLRPVLLLLHKLYKRRWTRKAVKSVKNHFSLPHYLCWAHYRLCLNKFTAATLSMKGV